MPPRALATPWRSFGAPATTPRASVTHLPLVRARHVLSRSPTALAHCPHPPAPARRSSTAAPRRGIAPSWPRVPAAPSLAPPPPSRAPAALAHPDAAPPQLCHAPASPSLTPPRPPRPLSRPHLPRAPPPPSRCALFAPRVPVRPTHGPTPAPWPPPPVTFAPHRALFAPHQAVSCPAPPSACLWCPTDVPRAPPMYPVPRRCHTRAPSRAERP
ncbi:hypothetical protein DENSPDRAFT_788365, partial [Dentipellis sp. KUC8613]